jgi:hypothetical protein
VAEAVHWFDLPAFYGVVLRRPSGVIAVWGYNYRISPVEDMMARYDGALLQHHPALLGPPSSVQHSEH